MSKLVQKNIAGYGLLLMEMQKNSDTGNVMTDDWKGYREMIPSTQHIQSKAEIFTIEGYNSLFSHFLARLRRQSTCYSTSVLMLEYSVELLMLKWNREVYILN